jgi:hypothetical protein
MTASLPPESLLNRALSLDPFRVFSTNGRLALATRHTTEKKGFVKNSWRPLGGQVFAQKGCWKHPNRFWLGVSSPG